MLELCERLGVVVCALLDGGAPRERLRPDRRVGVERLELLVLAQAVNDLVGIRERIRALRELLDETRPTFEELREVVDAQLPR